MLSRAKSYPVARLQRGRGRPARDFDKEKVSPYRGKKKGLRRLHRGLPDPKPAGEPGGRHMGRTEANGRAETSQPATGGPGMRKDEWLEVSWQPKEGGRALAGLLTRHAAPLQDCASALPSLRTATKRAPGPVVTAYEPTPRASRASHVSRRANTSLPGAQAVPGRATTWVPPENLVPPALRPPGRPLPETQSNADGFGQQCHRICDAARCKPSPDAPSRPKGSEGISRGSSCCALLSRNSGLLLFSRDLVIYLKQQFCIPP